MPVSSDVRKAGLLYKQGSITGMDVSRFYILRDNALFVYKDETQKYPYRVYPLRGLYVSFKTEKDSKTNNHDNSGNIDSS